MSTCCLHKLFTSRQPGSRRERFSAVSYTQALKAAGVVLVDLSLEAIMAAYLKQGDGLYYSYEMPRELGRYVPLKGKPHPATALSRRCMAVGPWNACRRGCACF